MIRILPIALLLAAAFTAQVHADQDETPPDLPFEAEALQNMDEDAAEAIIGSVNPLENDLRGLELAIRLHNAFIIEPDGAVFELGVTDGTGASRIDEDFVLIETEDVSSPTLADAQRHRSIVRVDAGWHVRVAQESVAGRCTRLARWQGSDLDLP
ncbi:MAG: hypothetical protein VXW22_04530, partial [Pseudomonadota bacterium]|nr:hypothetical protein [Pseudomonadota bacterium]